MWLSQKKMQFRSVYIPLSCAWAVDVIGQPVRIASRLDYYSIRRRWTGNAAQQIVSLPGKRKQFEVHHSI
jgi:hypothetical protein